MTQASDFGATGDGVTDDTSAIQHAIDEGVGELVLPRGDYRLTRPIVINLAKCGRTSIRGESGTCRILMQGRGTGIFICRHTLSVRRSDNFQRLRMDS